MALFTQHYTTHTSPRSYFVGDPETMLLHRSDCPDGPLTGEPFSDRQTATAEGYSYCHCAAPALIAPTDRIRALLATTLARN